MQSVSNRKIDRNLKSLLARSWWAGAGVIILATLAIIGIILSNSGSSIVIKGRCNNIGSNNDVCSSQYPRGTR
jgi:hypothetical protein